MTGKRTELLAALTRLLDDALDLDPRARAAMLARLRTDSPELAQELERLLALEPELDSRRFLAETGGAAASFDDDAPATLSLRGRAVGPYVLEAPLGQGGMGAVWLAHRGDGRFEGRVAVKLLNIALLDAVGVERFRREGTALARVAHPNVARLLDAGVMEGDGLIGRPYLVLEHVDGIRIDRYCDEHQRPPAERIRLVQQVIAAVAHAHANLIVHRDIKPSNILVTPEGAVRLLDFGIAKLLEAGGATAERTDLTERGGLPFTPEYAAPEQVTGGPITTATDVYTLGVLLYLLLAGRHPTAPGGGNAAEHLRAVVDTEPARLSAAVGRVGADADHVAFARGSTPDRLRRLYLGDLDNVLAKALRKDPAERYQSAAALGDDLERYLRSEPVSARRQSFGYRAGKFLRRNRMPVTAAVVVLASLAGLTAVALVQAREARRQRDAALYESRRADAQIEFQNLLMSQFGSAPLTMRDIVDRGRDVVQREYAAEPRVLGSMLLHLSRRYSELGDGSERYALLRRADSIATQERSAAAQAEVRCDIADYLRTEGRYDSALAVLAVADSLRLRAEDPVLDEWCLQIRSQLAAELRDSDAAVAAAEAAIASMEAGGRGGTPRYTEVLAALANAYTAAGRLQKAADVHRRTVEALDSTGRGGTVLRQIVQHNYAFTLGRLGQTREAERLFHEVVGVVSAAEGPIPTQPLVHYAEAALTQGHADSAAKYFSLLVHQAEVDSNRYWLGRGTFGLARAQARLGWLAAARATAERFRLLRRGFDRLVSTDDQVPDTLALAGWIALAAGDTAEAHQRLMASLHANGFFEGKRQTQQRAVALQAAETALALGRPDSARLLAERAYQIALIDSTSIATNALAGEARLIEARALLAEGDTAGARTVLVEAAAAVRAGAGPEHPRLRQAAALLDRVP